MIIMEVLLINMNPFLKELYNFSKEYNFKFESYDPLKSRNFSKVQGLRLYENSHQENRLGLFLSSSLLSKVLEDF